MVTVAVARPQAAQMSAACDWSGRSWRLELESQAELHDARKVRTVQHQEARSAGRIASVEGTATVGARQTDAASTGTADGIKLWVVKDVEIFPTEFKRVVFLECKALEQSEVKIDAAGKAKQVARRIAESQAGGQLEGCGVVAQYAKGVRGSKLCELVSGDDVGVADDVEPRGGSNGIGDSRVVGVRRSVEHIEG